MYERCHLASDIKETPHKTIKKTAAVPKTLNETQQ